MKTFSAALTLALATVTLAAPAAEIEKRVQASITLYPNTNYGGSGFTINFESDPGSCVSTQLPSSIDNQASSFRLSGDTERFNCRLYDQPNCQGDSTWFINWDVPDLSASDYNGMNDRTTSVYCGPRS